MSHELEIKNKTGIAEILTAYLVCSYLVIVLVLIGDGTAGPSEVAFGLAFAPLFPIIYLPLYTVTALLSHDYIAFLQGSCFFVSWLGLSVLFGRLRTRKKIIWPTVRQ